MKKTYTKPVLNMESFSLSQTIAYGCGNNLDFKYATHRNKYDCKWETGFGEAVFLTKDTCDIADEDYDGVCYNNPEGGWNAFASV